MVICVCFLSFESSYFLFFFLSEYLGFEQLVFKYLTSDCDCFTVESSDKHFHKILIGPLEQRSSSKLTKRQTCLKLKEPDRNLLACRVR